MEIADKSFKQNNLELKKTNTQVIENLSPNPKNKPAIAHTVNSGGPSDEEEKMYQEILKEKEAEERKRAKRKAKSERNKYAMKDRGRQMARTPNKYYFCYMRIRVYMVVTNRTGYHYVFLC